MKLNGKLVQMVCLKSVINLILCHFNATLINSFESDVSTIYAEKKEHYMSRHPLDISDYFLSFSVDVDNSVLFYSVRTPHESQIASHTYYNYYYYYYTHGITFYILFDINFIV